MKALNIEVAHIGGLSMGGALTLNFGIRYPEMAKSLIVAAAGTGSTDPEGFKKNVLNRALNLETHGMASMKDYAEGPARIQFKRKDPNGWQEFSDHLMSHSSVGSAMTFRGVQSPRPPIYSLEEGEYDAYFHAYMVDGNDSVLWSGIKHIEVEGGKRIWGQHVTDAELYPYAISNILPMAYVSVQY